MSATSHQAVVHFTVSDKMPDGDPTPFHKSMLDDVNKEARRIGWQGVAVARAWWCSSSRILTLFCEPGTSPATLHLLKKTFKRQAESDQEADHA